MSNDSWDWPGAFERAGKADGGRSVETLKPEDFARALRSMWTEHAMLDKADPRVQEISRAGRLEWWDGRGRCVVLVREALPISGPAIDRGPSGVTVNASSIGGPLPEPFDALANAPTFRPALEGTVEGHRAQEAQFERAAAPLIKAAEDRAIVAEQAKIDAPKPKGKKK
jgi:hypothetical protein